MSTADYPGNNDMPCLYGYTILEEAGNGSSARVYKALQRDTGKIVAIKIPRCEEDMDPLLKAAIINRFEQELQIGRTLDHPHIVRLLDKGITDAGIPFSVSEYIPGTTLKLWILQHRGLPVGIACGLMAQVLEALLHAHHKGIVHRDLKPQNIMVTETSAGLKAMVLDFGTGIFTATAEVIPVAGTCLYMAPEQLQGAVATYRSDLYAWGLILLECLTGKPAGRHKTMPAAQEYDHTELLLPESLRAHPLGDLLRKVLQAEPSQRIPDAALLYQAFKAIDPGILPYKLPFSGTVSYTGDDAQTIVRLS